MSKVNGRCRAGPDYVKEKEKWLSEACASVGEFEWSGTKIGWSTGDPGYSSQGGRRQMQRHRERERETLEIDAMHTTLDMDGFRH